MATLALIGCGNIGYRHLQAAASVPSIEEIWVVEPNQQRLVECTEGSLKPETKARLLGWTSLEGLRNAERPFDVVISAVTADVQQAQARSLVSIPTKALVLEKPVAQSKKALSELADLLAPIPQVFVNCPRALWPGYESLRRRLEEATIPLRVEITGNLWGYACNAVHYLELFRFLTGSGSLKAVSSQLSLSPKGNKRGSAYEEFVGTAGFLDEHGNALQLTCGYADERETAAAVVIRHAETRAVQLIVDEAAATIWHAVGGDLMQRSLDLLYVSQSTRVFLERLLTGSPTDLLPTFSAAYSSHEALLDSLQQATGREQFRIT